MNKVLYLVSFEPEGAYAPREVEFEGRLSCGERDDYVRARVSPPFEPRVFGTPAAVEHVVLAPRHAGVSLSQTNAWPVHVYVCVIEKEGLLAADKVEPSDLKILNWGLLYPTLQEAEAGKL